MKSTFITLTVIASIVGYSNGALVFKDPWAQSKTWRANEKAHITWTSGAADADKLCDIQMLNGKATNSNIVATVTDPGNPVKCGVNEFEIVPLNDFKTGKYWLRIGQAKTDTWTYSGVFDFEGKGTASPLKLADGTSSDYPTAEAPKDDAKPKKEKKKEEKMEEKKEKKKQEKKERKESAPRLASQGPSSKDATATATATASASNSAHASKSSFVLSPTNNDKGSMPPTVKKDNKNTEHDKKARSTAVSDVLQHNLIGHFAVMGFASFAAYFLI